jgi:hypothetical protein
MKINTILSYILFLLFFYSTESNAQTVYVTESGKKYHAKNCDIVKTGKKGIDLTEAKKKGFEPCKSCKVEKIVQPIADKPKDKKTK